MAPKLQPLCCSNKCFVPKCEALGRPTCSESTCLVNAKFSALPGRKSSEHSQPCNGFADRLLRARLGGHTHTSSQLYGAAVWPACQFEISFTLVHTRRNWQVASCAKRFERQRNCLHRRSYRRHGSAYSGFWPALGDTKRRQPKTNSIGICRYQRASLSKHWAVAVGPKPHQRCHLAGHQSLACAKSKAHTRVACQKSSSRCFE